MVTNIVRINGWPVAPAVARDFLRMKADHDRATGGNLRINSGYRTRSEQAAIFTSRYRRGAYSPYGDYRIYQGVTWGRVSGLGPVASPDVGSNHTRGLALDLNVTTGSASQKWLIEHSRKYGFNWVEGKSVFEPWHWCWNVHFRPDANTPDPWEGRGAPDPVHPTDPGIPIEDILAGGGGGGTGDLSMSDIRKIENYLEYLDQRTQRIEKRQIEIEKILGKRSNGASFGATFDALSNITRETRDTTGWIANSRIRGSYKGKSLTALAEETNAAVQELASQQGVNMTGFKAVVEEAGDVENDPEVTPADE